MTKLKEVTLSGNNKLVVSSISREKDDNKVAKRKYFLSFSILFVAFISCHY